jgi:hypothetical protein
MKFLFKKLKYLVLLLILVVVGGIFAAAYFIDSLARKGIEAGATYALGVPTTLKSANVGIMGGTFAMSELNVGNPQGFTSPHFLALGSGGVAVSLGTLRKETVELPSLTLEHIDVNLEKRAAAGGSNYKVILDNLDKLKGSGSKPSSSGEKRFVIRELSIKDVKVHINLIEGPAALEAVTKANVELDEIKLKDVGKTGSGVGGTGVTMSELASIIVQAVLSAAAEKGGHLIPGDILGDLKGKLASLDGVKDMGLKVLGDAKGSIQEAGKKALDDVKKKAEGAVKDTLDNGLKKLLPGGDKK